MATRKKDSERGLYDRNKGVPGMKPNWWIAYAITDELRIRFGLTKKTVREPGGSTQRAAKKLLADRREAVRAGSWRPATETKGEGYTFAALAEEWLANRELDGVKSLRNESQRLRQHVIPVIGDMRVTDVRRQDIRALIARFQTTPSEATEKLPAPRMVHRVYEDVRGVFSYALEVKELIQATPCTLKVARGELPKKKDADPRWRVTAVFSRMEVELLISDQRIELPRRVTYALMFLTGSRVGEVSGMRWGDYDATMEPLGRLTVATQYGGDSLKTDNPRLVPVHPVLAAMLAKWKLDGFETFVGRKPTHEDYIVPRIRTRGPNKKAYQDGRRVWVNLQADLEELGLRRRRSHDTRRTLITLARADGADKEWLHWITHGPSGDMMDLYSSPPWGTLCAQISCLRIELRKANGASVTPITAARPRAE